MKTLSLLLSLTIVTGAAAQKPLDRGIHKRKTGGVSILWGKNKQPAHVASHEEVTALPPLAPADMVLPRTTTWMASSSGHFKRTPGLTRGTSYAPIVAPLEQKGAVRARPPSAEKRMLHRPFSRMDSPSDGEATYDWASVSGLAMGLLALLLIDSSSFLTVILWLLGLGFSVYGMSRTKTATCEAADWPFWESSSLASPRWRSFWEWSRGSSEFSNLDPIFIQMTESTPHQAVLQGAPLLANIRMTFIMLTILILVLLSLLLRLVFIFFPKHIFLRFNVRFVIYPFSRLLMRIVGIKLVVEGKMPSSRHLIVSNHQGVFDSLLLMALSPCMVISKLAHPKHEGHW